MRRRPGAERSSPGRAALWAGHDRAWRDPLEVAAQWDATPGTHARLFEYETRGPFWDILADFGGCLILTREYEHLLVALNVEGSRRRVSYLALPHPNGLAIDASRRRLFVASTRNPNLLFELGAAAARPGREAVPESLRRCLLPVRCSYLPGRLYLHDLAFVGGRLCANAVGLNAVIRIEEDGRFAPAWWPRCIDGHHGPRFDRNYLQLNSIAAGRTLRQSFFTASAPAPSRRRPGQIDFLVDGRGVVFSGRTREVAATGLTRPHSLRLHEGSLFVNNSGYGELGRVADGRFEPLCRLPGWTRGLCLASGVAFVGTSRVLPRFRHYAPGLDPRRATAGVHAVELATGRILASLTWPFGNQLFGLELGGALNTRGFAWSAPAAERTIRTFYARAVAREVPNVARRRRPGRRQ